MKKLIILSLLSISSTVFADRGPTLLCTGKYIILEQKMPYLGEDSEYYQSLYVLKKTEDGGSELRDTAYFLNVFTEGATGTTILTGTNEVGGKFQLEYKRMENYGDGAVSRKKASGKISYFHGETLSGTNESVECVIE